MDSSLYRSINRLAVHTPWAHGSMAFFAVYGVGLFAVLVLAAWWVARRSDRAPAAVAACGWAAAGTIAAVGVNQLIGRAVDRGRPYAAMRHVEVLVGRTHDFSFPSDHAVTSGAAIAGLWIVAHYAGRTERIVAIVATVLGALVAFSRVYVGAHYPSDVLVGLVVGAAIVLAGWLVLARPLTWLAEWLSHRRGLRPLIVAPGHTPDASATA